MMENTMNNGLMVVEEGNNFIMDLTAPTVTAFCSMQATTPAEKVKLFNATNNPEKRVSDMINEVLEVKDVYVEVVKLVDQNTGEMKDCPRVVLIDKNGVGYQAVSTGVFSALKKLFLVFGTPTWEAPLKIKVKQLTKGERKILTLDAV